MNPTKWSKLAIRQFRGCLLLCVGPLETRVNPKATPKSPMSGPMDLMASSCWGKKLTPSHRKRFWVSSDAFGQLKPPKKKAPKASGEVFGQLLHSLGPAERKKRSHEWHRGAACMDVLSKTTRHFGTWASF